MPSALHLCILCRIGLFWLLAVTITFSQEADRVDIVDAYNKAISSLKAQKHQKALELCNAVISEYGGANQGKEQFGPVYGHWFYLRGIALMGSENWAKASDDFEACYKCSFQTPRIRACKRCKGFGRYVPPVGNRDPDGKVRCKECGGVPYLEKFMPNQFRMHALVQWGNAQMVLKDYAKSRELYQKALTEDRSQRLNFNWKMYVAVNLGRCLIKSGSVDEGYNYIVRALDADRFPLSIKQMVFQVLAEDWTPVVGADRTREFLDKYRHIPLSASPEERARRNPNFFYLANDALNEKNDPLLALSWYRLIAHPGKAIAELNSTIDRYEARKEAESRPEVTSLIDEEIKKKTGARDLMSNNFWSMQAGNGIAWFKLKNYAASFSSYRGLADYAPKQHEGRPEFLHNAVISAVKIDHWPGAYKYGMAFLDEFPEHRLKPPVVRVLVEMVFIQGNYAKAYEIAKDVRSDMEPGSDDRDIPDFIVGASAFQLGKIDEADSELTSYLSTYDPGKRRELARYFLGSIKVKKYNWQEATDIFEPFLSDYPESGVTSSVLYQNGMCKFMLDDNESALALIDRLMEEFPNAAEVTQGWNLRGDIQSVEEADYDTEINPAYSNAISTAAKFPGQEEVAAYAMWQQMMNLAGLERWEEAGQWFDRFQTDHPNSAYSIDMLIGALETLSELGRTDEAIQRLETQLYNAVTDPAGNQLGELFGTYLDFLKEQARDQALERLDSLMLSTETSETLEAWAMLGKIQILEDAEGENREAIQSIFYKLNNNFDPSIHSNFIIVRLARWHTETRKKPEDAAPFYDYILENREGSEDFDLALLDRAEIDAKSDVPEDLARAMQYFDRVLSEFDNDELVESASVGIARLLMKDKKYEEALPRWEAYMDNAAWNKFAAEANYSYGLCLDLLGKTDEALVVYINTYNAFPGYLDFSTVSYIRAALIMKEKGEDLKALLILKDMLTRMREVEHPNKKKALQLFMKWRSDYVPPKKEGGK